MPWACVTLYAQDTGDETHCELLAGRGDLEPAGITQEMCLAGLAIDWQREDLCARLEVLRGSCYYKLALESGKSSYCRSVEPEALKQVCEQETAAQ